MLLAYRRGLLKPDYKHGTASHLREHLLLIALNRELEAEEMYGNMLYEAVAFSPHIDPKKVVGYIEQKQDLRDFLSEYGKGSPRKYISAYNRLLATSGGLVRAFQILKEHGIIDKIKRRNAKKEEDS